MLDITIHTDRLSNAKLHELINRLMEQGVVKQL